MSDPRPAVYHAPGSPFRDEADEAADRAEALTREPLEHPWRYQTSPTVILEHCERLHAENKTLKELLERADHVVLWETSAPSLGRGFQEEVEAALGITDAATKEDDQ